jgi:DNA/RNA-binding domain of Phe-tRNA-synthetase-like protein
MEMLTYDSRLKDKFPRIEVLTSRIKGIKVERRSAELEKFKEEIVKGVKENYKLESLKDLAAFKAYRDFFWRVGVDPTKNRPASEALIRRILGGKPLPSINTFVDAYNLASIRSEIPLAAFDAEKTRGALYMRFANSGEEFLGIGMEKPMTLKGGEVVITDEEKIVAIYPHRDAESTKITEETRNVILMTCGVPGISAKKLQKAKSLAIEYVTRFCGGEPES